jgi:hypothetical protein
LYSPLSLKSFFLYNRQPAPASGLFEIGRTELWPSVSRGTKTALSNKIKKDEFGNIPKSSYRRRKLPAIHMNFFPDGAWSALHLRLFIFS